MPPENHKIDPSDLSDNWVDLDADTGAKSYRGQREDGTVWEKIKYWFGYKLHLIVDADYELPVAFRVTKAYPFGGQAGPCFD